MYDITNKNKRRSLNLDYTNLSDNKKVQKNYFKIIKNKEKLIQKLDNDIKKNKYDNVNTINNLKNDIKSMKRQFELDKYKLELEKSKLKNERKILEKEKLKKESNKNKSKNLFVSTDEYEKYNYLKKRDMDTVYDPLSPPERRLPRHIYPKKSIKKHFNYPTRGYPDDYQMLGILSRESDENILQLYGRQLYPGSSQWEYYLIRNGLESVKIPIKKGNNQEIDNNEILEVPQFNSSKGKFKVTLYKLDAPRYNPNIY
jgi:hypothetical protein